LEISDIKLYERLENRRYDEETGVIYNAMTNPTKDPEIVS